MRDRDEPREPAGRSTRRMAHVERADGAVVPHAFLPGSVIVKFRSGATARHVISAMRGGVRLVDRASVATPTSRS